MVVIRREGIIHCDLAARNVLVFSLPPGRVLVKVSDFGLSRISSRLNTAFTSTVVPVRWCSIEVLERAC
jgi:serine/threonine protein kinase